MDEENYIKSDGFFDYDAYHAALVARGRRCWQCGAVLMPALGTPTLCPPCTTLHNTPGAVAHPTHIRCPHCAHIWDFSTQHFYDPPVSACAAVYTVKCPRCETDFSMEWRLIFIYKSPPKHKSL